MPSLTLMLSRIILMTAVATLVACGGSGPRLPDDDSGRLYGGLNPDHYVFGAPSTGGLMLFAQAGQYEIVRTDRNAQFIDPPIVVAGNLGPQYRLAGIAIGRRHTSILAQHEDGELRLHRLVAGGLDPVSIPLSVQASRLDLNLKARSFALHLANPRDCLEGEAQFLLLMVRPEGSGLEDEVWYVRENGQVKERKSFTRPAGWEPLAVGSGAVESSKPWILFASADRKQAKLVQAQELALTLNVVNVPEVSFIPVHSSLSSLTMTPSGYAFATTVRPGGHVYWWQIYRWDTPYNWFLVNPVAGPFGAPADRELAVVMATSPSGLGLVSYADLRPPCLSWRTLPYPEKLLEQKRAWEEIEEALEDMSPARPPLNTGQ